MNHDDVVIVSAVRTPIGAHSGRCPTCGRMTWPLVIKAAGPGRHRRRAGGGGLPGLRQPGGRRQSQRGAHGAAAGRPAPPRRGVTVNRLCASGLNAVNQAARSSAARATSSWPAAWRA
ncbi:MAG: hypothetical protein R2851_28795 [Caldilineaceae bacterium]